jgi:arylsulfatase A-like enzyme
VRGYKRDLTDNGVRVPLIARWPGRIPAGKDSQFVGYFADLYPTFIEIAGGKPPQDLDGISFVPELLGHSAQQKPHEYLYWEFYEGGSSQAVRFGDWKVIRKPFGTGPVQVYNLASDLGEEHDLAKNQPDIATRGVKYMDEAHVTSPLWPVPKAKPAGRSSK